MATYPVTITILCLSCLTVVTALTTFAVEEAYTDATGVGDRPPFDIPNTVMRLGETTLLGLILEANLAGPLAYDAPLTLFAPTNAAVAALPPATLAYLRHNKTALSLLLRHHVAASVAASRHLTNNQMLKTLAGDELRVNVYDTGAVTVGCAVVNRRRADVVTTNGLVSLVDKVVNVPMGSLIDTVDQTADLSKLSLAFKKAGIEALKGGPSTLFAPSDAAFAKLDAKTLRYLLAHQKALERVLTYHVSPSCLCTAGLAPGQQTLPTLSGLNLTLTLAQDGTVDVNMAVVTSRDVTARDGVMHVIDSLLLPPGMDVQ